MADINSRQIKSVDYHADDWILVVQLNNCETYRYLNVPHSVFEQLITAVDADDVLQSIRMKYTCR